MTPEQLLNPRCKVVADYPDSEFEVGEILVSAHNGVRWVSEQRGYYVDWMKIHKWPHIFKPLEWWEDRTPEDMPEYYKYSGTNGVYKTSFRANPETVLLNFSPTETVSVGLEYTLPATEEEYNNYINNKEANK